MRRMKDFTQQQILRLQQSCDRHPSLTDLSTISKRIYSITSAKGERDSQQISTSNQRVMNRHGTQGNRSCSSSILISCSGATFRLRPSTFDSLLDPFSVEHDLARAQGYHCFFSHCKVPRKQSYSGVATFVRSGSGLRTLASTSSLSDTRFFGALTRHGQGVSLDRLGEIDAEGRVLVTDHGHFVLFNIYGPCIR